MKLTEHNLTEWKNEMDEIAKRRMPHGWQALSETLSDDEWIRDYIGEDSENVVLENLQLLII